MHPDVHCSIITMDRTWKESKRPLKEGWIKNMWYICTMKYYSAIKGKEIVPFAEMQMDLETDVQKEVRKRKILYNIIHMWNLEKWYR